MPEFPPILNLSSLDGSNGFRLDGGASSDLTGYSVSSAGDVNGDGFDDIIVGAYGASPNGNVSAGASYVVFGRAGGFGPTLSPSSLDGGNGFRIDGAAAFEGSGRSVSSAGDVNGDGFDDILVGASSADPNGIANAGASYVVFGRAGGFGSAFALSSLNGGNGFRLDGVAADDRSGRSVSSAGDVNGDGFDDLIVGASFADPNSASNAGASYVVFGRAGGFGATLALSSLNGGTGFRLDGAAAGDRSGLSVSSAGDVNGDGFDDILVGAFETDPNGLGSAGSSYVVFGRAGGFAPTLALSSLNGSNGFRLDGVEAGDRSGLSVSSAGDVNGDGFADVVVGAAQADPNGNISAGSSYVVFGRAGGFAATLALSSLDGTTGFRIEGAAARDFSGFSVSSAGDVNGDGFDDVLVGAAGASPNGLAYAGSSFVIFGRTGGFAASIDLASLDGANGFRIDGVVAAADSGRSVSSAGDLNGDGFDDILVGAPFADLDGGSNTGASYVVFGRAPDTAVTRTGTEAANTISGGAFGDTLIGLGGADTLIGNGGADMLNGGTGADTLRGGAGSDTYLVGTGLDRVFEAANAGSDRVNASVSYVLTAGQHVETLATTSAAGTGAITLTGNAFAQTLFGNAGVNTLNGAGGADTLQGFGGNDTYVVDNAGDRVLEAAGGGMADRVNASTSYALAAGLQIEILGTTSVAGTGAINLTGNATAQTLLGNAGANFLNGAGGADTLSGFSGSDTFSFTTALGAGNVDHVTDFSVTADTIRLAKAIFSALGIGPLAASAFKDVGDPGAVVDASDRILYDDDTGELFYDTNGSGAGGRTLFAVLDTSPDAVTFADFVVVA